MKLSKTANNKTVVKLSQNEWTAMGTKAGWLDKQAGIEASFETPISKTLHNFLTNLMKKSGGYFVEDGEKEKYQELLEKYRTSTDDYGNLIGEIKQEGNTNIIDIKVSYSISFTVDGDLGSSEGSKSGTSHKTFVVDKNGVIKVTKIGGGKDRKAKNIFQRDETYTPRKTDDFQTTYSIGETYTKTLTYQGERTHQRGTAYMFSDNDNKLITFSRLPKNLHKVIEETIKGSNLYPEVNKTKFLAQFSVKKIDVYKDALSHIIEIQDINIDPEYAHEENIRFNKNIFDNQLKFVDVFKEQIGDENLKLLKEKYFSPNSNLDYSDLDALNKAFFSDITAYSTPR